jgi:hypothetical protein
VTRPVGFVSRAERTCAASGSDEEIHMVTNAVGHRDASADAAPNKARSATPGGIHGRGAAVLQRYALLVALFSTLRPESFFTGEQRS